MSQICSKGGILSWNTPDGPFPDLQSVQKHENGASSILRIGLRKIEEIVILALFPPKCQFWSSKKGSQNQAMLVVKHINSDPVFRSLKIYGSNYRRTAAVRHPPDAARKKWITKSNEDEEEEEAHQFFFTTGRIERFAQKKIPQSHHEDLGAGLVMMDLLW